MFRSSSLKVLSKEFQDWIITIYATPLEDLVQRTQLAWPQTEEVSVLPASPVEDEAQSTRELPNRTRLIAYLGKGALPSPRGATTYECTILTCMLAHACLQC